MEGREFAIPAAAEKIIERLEARGYEAYVVGGCVRDMILGRKPGDWDITTSALPQQVKQVFCRTVDTGIQHGTVTVLAGGTGYEVTTYRLDGEYRDGRHPSSVTFTPSLEEDLKRRDFTINAMAYNRRIGLVDIFGGTEDLKRGLIRCVGEARERFGEDALRILRAVRFSAQLGFAVEPATWQAVCELAPNLIHVSKERIQAELTKLLLSPHPERMELVWQSGICRYVTEGFESAAGAASGGGTAADEAGRRSGLKQARQLPCIPDSVPAVRHLRWAAFLRRLPPEAAVSVLRGLKLDNDTIGRVRTLVDWTRRALPAGAPALQASVKPALRRVMSAMPPELFDDLLTLKRCLAQAGEGEVPETPDELERTAALAAEIRADGDCLSLKTLAVGGRDVMAAGVKPGREVGEVLERLFQLVLDEPSRNTREYLLSQL